MDRLAKRIREGGDSGMMFPLEPTPRREAAFDRISTVHPGRRRKVLVSDLSQFRRPTGVRLKNKEHTAAMALTMKRGRKFRPIKVQVIPGTKDIQVLDGAHRFEAARMIGMTKVPVIVAPETKHLEYTGIHQVGELQRRRTAERMQAKPHRLYSHSELQALAENAPKPGSLAYRVNHALASAMDDIGLEPIDYRTRRRVQKSEGDMPYQSAKQRAFMHIHHPDIASRWDEEYGGKVKRKKVHKAAEEVEKGFFPAKKKEKKPYQRPQSASWYDDSTRRNFGKRQQRDRDAPPRLTPKQRAALEVAVPGTLGALAAAGVITTAVGGGFKPLGRKLTMDGQDWGKLPIGSVLRGNAALAGGAMKRGGKELVTTMPFATLGAAGGAVGGAYGSYDARVKQLEEEEQKRRRRVARKQIKQYNDAYLDDLVDKSLFGHHGNAPGSHERKQHGKTALRVSPDERAALALLGLGTAATGGAAVLGGYRPVGRAVQWPTQWGAMPAEWALKRPPEQIVTANVRAIGRGLKNTGEAALANPAAALGVAASVAGTGAAAYKGVRAYGRRKEKDLPFRRAEKHLRRLERMEGDDPDEPNAAVPSPELKTAIASMRVNANKQARFPREALNELNELGYKYGYARSGRYDRAYGPFPMDEPGIQEPQRYRNQKVQKAFDAMSSMSGELPDRYTFKQPSEEEVAENKRKHKRNTIIASAAGGTAALATVGTLAAAAHGGYKPMLLTPFSISRAGSGTKKIGLEHLEANMNLLNTKLLARGNLSANAAGIRGGLSNEGRAAGEAIRRATRKYRKPPKVYSSALVPFGKKEPSLRRIRRDEYDKETVRRAKKTTKGSVRLANTAGNMAGGTVAMGLAAGQQKFVPDAPKYALPVTTFVGRTLAEGMVTPRVMHRSLQHKVNLGEMTADQAKAAFEWHQYDPFMAAARAHEANPKAAANMSGRALRNKAYRDYLSAFGKPVAGPLVKKPKTKAEMLPDPTAPSVMRDDGMTHYGDLMDRGIITEDEYRRYLKKSYDGTIEFAKRLLETP